MAKRKTPTYTPPKPPDALVVIPPEPLDFVCLTCGAPGGWPCTTDAGEVIEPHADRGPRAPA